MAHATSDEARVTGQFMSHHIHGFIADHEPLWAAARLLPHARVCRLRLGFGFLPLTDRLAPRDDPSAGLDHLYRLTAPMASWAAGQSTRFPIAYVQTDYFGGPGSQCAVVWSGGAVAFGPLKTNNEADDNTPLLDGAINRAVRHLGVLRRDKMDEFEALGLHLHRDNEDWIENGGVGPE